MIGSSVTLVALLMLLLLVLPHASAAWPPFPFARVGWFTGSRSTKHGALNMVHEARNTEWRSKERVIRLGEESSEGQPAGIGGGLRRGLGELEEDNWGGKFEHLHQGKPPCVPVYTETTCLWASWESMLNNTKEMFYERFHCVNPKRCISPSAGTFNLDGGPPSEPLPRKEEAEARIIPCVGSLEGMYIPRHYSGVPHIQHQEMLNVSATGRDQVTALVMVTMQLHPLNLQWQPSDSDCKPHWFSPRQIYECLKGRRVLISGESCHRQMFASMYNMLRQQPKPMLSDVHQSCIYQMDGTKDSLQSCEDRVQSRLCEDTYHKPDVAELLFRWCPERLPSVEEMADLRPDILITSNFFWDETDGDKQRKQALEIMQSDYRPKKLLFPLSPIYTGTNGHIDVLRDERNRKNIDFFISLAEAYPGQVYLIPSHQMDAKAPWPSLDGMHHQCGANDPMRHAWGSEKLWDLYSSTLPNSTACWDAYGSVLTQYMLNFMCLL